MLATNLQTTTRTVKDLSTATEYLSFRLDNDLYGIPILKVQEIIGVMPVAHVPGTPGHVRGIANLRGKVIPIVDLRLRFKLAPTEDTPRTCVVIVSILQGEETLTIGLVVDSVAEVMHVAQNMIEPPPSFDAGADTAYLLGIGKLDSKLILLLDVDLTMAGDSVTFSNLIETNPT